ncbi:MAG: hypothetical protein JRH10_11615 [Deltaproteobacteria bacterium]|nr:hypothetical protein [Deltaproteobacteria bacterium]
MEYLDVEEARERPGLRLVLTSGVPGPWGEAAKALFTVKGVEFAPVAQAPGQPNEALFEWTGSRNAPVAILDDEPAVSGWNEMVVLAERLAPEPALLPEDAEARALVLGLSHEICGPDGFGWCRRLWMLHAALSQIPSERLADPAFAILRTLASRYGYDPARIGAVRQRIAALLRLFSNRLHAQRERGSAYLVGGSLSAVDLHWATFAAMVEPLPAKQCPMPEPLRAGYSLSDPELRAAADPILLEHRDHVYREHLTLPLDF